MKLVDIPKLYKAGAVLVAATVFVMTYHLQFQTKVLAAEAKQLHDDQITLLIVTLKEEQKNSKVQLKIKAVAAQDAAESERLEQEIQTLRDQIKSLCDQIEDC